MELFEAVRCLFEDKKKWQTLSQYDKKRFFFMINRICAINYPLVSNAFNHTRISQAEALDYWADNLSSVYSRTPKWVYCKTKKVKVEKIKMPSSDAIAVYLQKMKMSRRDLDQAIKTFGESALESIRAIDKLLE